jgi:hypothetical protein
LKLTCRLSVLELIHELPEPNATRHRSPRIGAVPLRRRILEQRVPMNPPRFGAHGVVGRTTLVHASWPVALARVPEPAWDGLAPRL